jgi:hypothetical protein
MNAGPSRDFPTGDDVDPRHDAVWRLLDRAPRPEPDAWFVTRALARCRGEKRAALLQVWRWALGGGLGVCLAVSLLVAQVAQVHTQAVAEQKNVQEAFEIMASIDPAPSAASESDPSASASSWQDTSL